jgi:hypothetical protein
VLDSSTARRHLRAIDPLLNRFDLRGRAALDWLREPFVRQPSGLLFLTKLPSDAGSDTRRAARREVPAKPADPRSVRPTAPPSENGELSSNAHSAGWQRRSAGVPRRNGRAPIPPPETPKSYISPSKRGCGMRSGLSLRYPSR